MTVCVAVLCNNSLGVIGACDRMLSTMDNRFQMPKLRFLTGSIVMMLAGDVLLHSELIVSLEGFIRHFQANSDGATISVKEIAEKYAELYINARLSRAEKEFLMPIGLNMNQFLARQSELNDRLVNNLATELVNFRLPLTSAIFAGIDISSGISRAHLYSVDGSNISCHDDIGFASIGSGQNHALSNLMFSAHSNVSTMERALYLTYASKRRAEVAPNVGPETDMFVAQPEYCVQLHTNVLHGLQEIYSAAENEHLRTNAIAEGKCHEYIQSLVAAPSVESDAASKTELPQISG